MKESDNETKYDDITARYDEYAITRCVRGLGRTSIRGECAPDGSPLDTLNDNG